MTAGEPYPIPNNALQLLHFVFTAPKAGTARISAGKTMAATDFTTAERLPAADGRAGLNARLDMIAGNLRSSGPQVALASLALVLCFDGRITGFTSNPTIWLDVWATVQLGIAALFFTARVMWPPGMTGTRFGLDRRTAYAALYFVSGASWGALTWIAIVPDDVLNQVFVVLIVICLSMIYIVRLTACTPIYFAANAGLFLVSMPSAFVMDDGLSRLLVVAGPFWLALLGAAAWRLGNQISEMIEMRLRECELAARLAEAHAHAEAASRSKSAFLANMSHELRTPLNAIIGFSDVMRAGMFGALDERYRAYANDIHVSGAHLLSLINDVLDIAKIESGQMKLAIAPVALIDIAPQAVRLLQSKADARQQKLHLSLTGAPGTIMADQRALTQILLNLAGNALKYSQAGAVICIAARADARDVVLTVADNGPGIPLDKQARLFKPFERVDNSYLAGDGGTGLGLSLVRELAALHGGTASIESAPGQGTTVHVRLPGAVVQRAA